MSYYPVSEMFSWFWLQIISIPLGTMTLPSFRFTIQTLFVLKQMYTLKTSDGRFSVWISLSTWIPGILICLQVFKTWKMPQLCQSFKFITLKNLPTISRKYYANYQSCVLPLLPGLCPSSRRWNQMSSLNYLSKELMCACRHIYCQMM